MKGISGHASTFVIFVASILVPFIDTTYRTVKTQRAVAGKSFGGNCVAHIMLQSSSIPLFIHFLLCFAALVGDDETFFRMEEESWKSRPTLSAKVFFVLGKTKVAQSEL